ncbi:MAG: AraC family transcriptional regulator [Sphingomonadales bacterium]|nr:AraC family transcriptional regulator [Sphingomonadales bacterium]MDE2169043.1 AraC family transcriptional regulator [Sphingomonadales bacterium]
MQVRFFRPPANLGRFFTTFYLAEIAVPHGGRALDYLHPEWANLRFHKGDELNAENYVGQRISGVDFAATGPSSRALRFEVGTCRIWGIGLMPLGWARFIAAPADTLADAVVDGNAQDAFAAFRPLADTLFGEVPDVQAELARISGHFLAMADVPLPDEARIMAIHAALVDPDVASVSELVKRVGVSQRTVERVCARAFGFSPKLLLRRQRFMRSLSHYMLDPSLKWIGALDGHYHDQAQFVREFREFMGMTPRQYAALDHPIIEAIMNERARMLAGAAVQALDAPDGERGA